MTRLQQLRLDAGLTVSALADKAGVDGRTIAKIERRGSCHPATLVALAEFLSTDDLRVQPSELVMPAIPPRQEQAA